MSIHDTRSFEELPSEIDTLVVGGDEAPLRAAIRDQDIGAWLARVAPHSRRIASVCSGAFALAAAGLLDGHEATTHWRALDLLADLFPRVRVQREQMKSSSSSRQGSASLNCHRSDKGASRNGY